MKKLAPLLLIVLFAAGAYSQSPEDLSDDGATPELGILGLILILVGILLIYKLLKKAGGAEEDYDSLGKKEEELKDLINRTKYDFFKRRIAEDKADKLIREYEEQVKKIIETRGKLKKEYDLMDAHLSRATKPRNLLTIVTLLIFLLTGSLFLGALEPIFKEPFRPYGEEKDFDPYQAMELCPSAPSQRDVDGCFFDAARRIANEDPDKAIEYCSQITMPNEADSCLTDIAYGVATTNLSRVLEICALISDPKKIGNDCCRPYFLETREVIRERPDLPIECCKLTLGDSEGRGEYCMDLARELAHFGDVQSAIEICGLILDQGDQGKCYLEVIREIGEEGLDTVDSEAIGLLIESCSEILNTGSRENCYWEMANSLKDFNATLAVEVCRRMEGGDDRGGCMREVQRILIDEDIDMAIEQCLNTPESNEAMNCLWGIMEETRDPESQLAVCKSFPIEKKMEDCFFRIIQDNRGDPQLVLDVCGYMEDTEKSDNCYYEVFRNLRDNATMALLVCNKIKDKTTKDNCLLEAARELDGMEFSVRFSTCEKVSQPTKSKDCISNLIWSYPEDLLEDDNLDLMLDYCSGLSTNQEDDCYQNIARNIYDFDRRAARDVCELMRDDWRMNECKKGNF